MRRRGSVRVASGKIPRTRDEVVQRTCGAVAGLAVMPKRWGLARESRHFDEEIRQALYGKRGGIYRILFVVRGDVVHVIHIRHAGRLELSPDEVRLPEQGGEEAGSSNAGEAP